jgi:hypothetical protein
MKFKTAFVLLTFSVALVASGPIGQVIAHSQSYGNVAWAQDAVDSEQGPDVSSEPSVTPPDVQGTWAGPIVDASAGTTTLTVDIFQNHSKLKGTWLVPGGSGSFKGKISADGMTALFKFKGHHGCKVTAPGTIDSATEISGTYTSKHCNGITSGTYDMTLQP